jgi:hypothetical protein
VSFTSKLNAVEIVTQKTKNMLTSKFIVNGDYFFFRVLPYENQIKIAIVKVFF